MSVIGKKCWRLPHCMYKFEWLRRWIILTTISLQFNFIFHCILTNQQQDRYDWINSLAPQKNQSINPSVTSLNQSFHPGFIDTACASEDTFVLDTDYFLGDLKEKSKIKISSPIDCCTVCDRDQSCTHWTFNKADSTCWLKNGPKAKITNINGISGRVSLNKFLERRVVITGKVTYKCVAEGDQSPSSAEKTFNNSNSRPPTKYIVINEPRSGSSWLQEMSQMHPGIMVQFELDLQAGDAALNCLKCRRPQIPDSKNASRLPRKLRPPLACGLTIFSGLNRFGDVAALAGRHNASLVLLLRRDHVAHAVSEFLHFNRPRRPGEPLRELLVPWDDRQLRHAVDESRQAYERLTEYPAATGRPAHLIFFEDMRRDPDGVWRRLQLYLGLPPIRLPAIERLEARSTSRPSAEYLQRLPYLRRQLNGTRLGRMLEASLRGGGGGGGRDDDELDGVGEGTEFARLCRRYAEVELSWRGGRCRGGIVQPWEDEAAEKAETTAPGKAARVMDWLRRAAEWAARAEGVVDEFRS